MSKHSYPYPGPGNRSTAALWPARMLLVLYSAALLFGCTKAATVNRDITSIIAGAGAAASKAEQQYQNKLITQTPAARNTINTLGEAYNQARAAFLVVLDVEKIYQSAEALQISACAPSPTGGSPSNCATTTQGVANAQAELQKAQNDLNAKISSLATQTKAVQALK